MKNRGLMEQSFRLRHEPGGIRWVARYWVDAGTTLHATEEEAWEACAEDNAGLLALEAKPVPAELEFTTEFSSGHE